MALAGREARRPEADRVLPEPLGAPGPVFEQVRRELGNLLSCPLLSDGLRDRHPFGGQGIPPFDPLVDPERLARVPALPGMLLADAAHRPPKRLQFLGRGAQLLEEGTQRFGRSAGSPGRFDLSPLSDPDRAILLEGSGGAAALPPLRPPRS